MRYQNVAVIGGTGFIGAYVVSRLLAAGRQVRLAVRSRARAKHLQMLPVSIIECDIYDAEQLADFLAGADAVINLVGILQDVRRMPYGPGFKKAHVDLPEKIVAACRATHVRRFLHISAIGAASNAPSMYLRSKGDGEAIINAANTPPLGVHTTIYRPSVVFGPGDKFLNTFAAMQKIFPVMPLACAGAKFQPVYVDDVAAAMVNTLDQEAAYGKTYELAGPRVYTLAELVRYAGRASGHARPVIGLPEWVGRLQGAIFEHLPNAPITRDNIDSMRIPSTSSGPLDPILGVTPSSVEAIAGAYLSGQPVGQRVSVPAKDRPAE